jgi:hypothetical protein
MGPLQESDSDYGASPTYLVVGATKSGAFEDNGLNGGEPLINVY